MAKLFLLLLFLFFYHCVNSAPPPHACDPSNPTTKLYQFCRTELPVNKRARDLVSRLTVDEKISQLVNTAPGIPRLGVPAYEWWSEALHGVAGVGPGIRFNGTVKAATSFPQVILTAASFDSYEWFRIAQVIGREARGVYNAGQAKGMTFWAPNINIFRDPRWGRGQETPGEDPMMTGSYAVAYVRGLQGDSFDGRKSLAGHLQASACCKHFTAYDLDRWNGITRYVFNAQVSLADLAETYQPPFKKCVEEGRASGVMCSYNRVNGIPTCADPNLLTQTARGLWRFQGYITSDCDAVSIIHDAQGYAKTPEDAVADVLKAGMDVNCGSYLQKHTKSALQQKKVSEYDIDRALLNLISVRIRLGLFNGDPTKLPYGNISPNEVCAPAHQALALEAARNGIVLLKNNLKLLPLSKASPSLAVIGPNAYAAKTLQGNYAGPPCKTVTPLDALRGYVKNAVYHQGCDSVACSNAAINQAVAVARNADHVVMIMGLDLTQEKEDLDRVSLSLPGKQQELITSVANAAKKPVVLVLICGGPVDVSFATNNNKIGSIIWAGYPGEAGGTALAEIIFGDHNPGGRLPVTWYPQSFVNVKMTDMRMRSATGYPGRTYKFYKGPKVFEFGHGLSYSKYSYQFKHPAEMSLYLNQTKVQTNSDSVRYALVSEMEKQGCNVAKTKVTVTVENQGEMAGKHPVLMFARHERGGEDGKRAEKQLVGFKSIVLSNGEKAEMEFEIGLCEHLSRANEVGLMVVEEGKYFLTVGDSELPLTVNV
ncbi:PREDICTED: probable beta-D-xylosidase 7 isoform X3 [Camelina sativa]|uniref:Probable beta-D-xylosidase 7 isoform X1 n=1 Tax=Camelina sativa TaxID=90675 RepID=A0ABM0TNF3_CAMSA|nr:PREDICTED: probable beta-D-xylosidase 7 isoform X1 [Camelina sativa]XP_010428911.1 PREDICTED: probable beta-D-xylosidase 7 isoform X3 [Camelina sativa]